MIKDRQLYSTIKEHVSKKEYSIIIGARQVGKTTLIQKLYSELKETSNDIFYITFEDKNILQDIDLDFENLFRYVTRPGNPLFKTRKNRIILFIDEIQYAANPSNFLKYLYDTYQENLKIIATGSSPFYLDTKFKDSLAGRKRIFHLKSLDFNEFLNFKDEVELQQELSRIRQNEQYISKHYNELLYYFNEYLTYGGYPKIVLENNTKEKVLHLNELITSFLKKDIYESNIEQEQKFYNLITLLSAQIGKLLNKNELANTLGLNQRTIDKYLSILQKCFYIDLLYPFYRNIRKEITKMPKVYFSDFGIRNKILNRFNNLPEREDKGEIIENYIHLRLKEQYSKEQIKYWHTTGSKEVDFVINETYDYGKAYEIKFSDSEFHPAKYKLFKNSYPTFPLECISYQTNKASIPILKF